MTLNLCGRWYICIILICQDFLPQPRRGNHIRKTTHRLFIYSHPLLSPFTRYLQQLDPFNSSAHAPGGPCTRRQAVSPWEIIQITQEPSNGNVTALISSTYVCTRALHSFISSGHRALSPPSSLCNPRQHSYNPCTTQANLGLDFLTDCRE